MEKKYLCIIILSLAIWGCSSSTGSDEDASDQDNNEPVEYTLSVSADPSEGGTVDPANESFEANSEVTVTANPNENWKFRGWSGDIESEENPLTFTISEDTELTANFNDQRSEYRMAISLNHTYEYDSRFHFYFGQSSSATRGYDELDDKAPPPPPNDAFHAYFETDSLDLFDDFRSDTSTNTTWDLKYQIKESDDLIMTWETLDATKARGELTMTDEDQSFEIDMFEQTTDTIRGTTEGTLIINYKLDE